MKVLGHNKSPDWPKLGPSILIATALVVAIRTARWATQGGGDAALADVDTKLDAEVSFAARITLRVMHELIRKHQSLFPQKLDPIYDAAAEDEDIQR